jgi:hypothetical protein
MSQLLIDSGRSEVGWSWYGNYSRCLAYGAYTDAGYGDTSDPLVRGTLLHVGLAHQHVHWQCTQERRDPEAYYRPEAAMEEWCRRHPEGARHLAQIIDVLRRYLAKYPEAPGRILGVEMLVRGVLGTRGGAWGLWTLAEGQEWFGQPWRAGQPLPKAYLGGDITPSVIAVPGAAADGQPIMLTRRVDLVLEDRARVVRVWDWKGTSGDVSRSRARKYAMSGEFPATRTLCSQLYDGRFGGISLGLIQNVPPFSVGRHPVPATPWRDARFAGMIHRLAHTITQLKRDCPTPFDYPMAQHELVCTARYGVDGGECWFMDACMLGPAGLPGTR